MRVAADFLTSALCVVLLAFFAKAYMCPAPTTVTPPQQSMQIDETVANFSEASQTLIVALRSDCRYCQESMPFYRRLLNGDRRDMQIVVAASPGDTGIINYLASEGVKPDSIVLVEPYALPVSGTPTLLLVDSEGLVTHAWMGLLDADREAEVVTTIFE